MRVQLYDYLTNYAGLTALVSTRIYPQRVPTGKALPTLSYTFDGRTPEYDQSGVDGTQRVTVEFNCNAATLGEAVDISNQIYAAFNIQMTEIGPLGNKVYLHSATLLNEFDNFDLFDGSEDGARIVTMTYEIIYK